MSTEVLVGALVRKRGALRLFELLRVYVQYLKTFKSYVHAPYSRSGCLAFGHAEVLGFSCFQWLARRYQKSINPSKHRIEKRAARCLHHKDWKTYYKTARRTVSTLGLTCQRKRSDAFSSALGGSKYSPAFASVS